MIDRNNVEALVSHLLSKINDDQMLVEQAQSYAISKLEELGIEHDLDDLSDCDEYWSFVTEFNTHVLARVMVGFTVHIR